MRTASSWCNRAAARRRWWTLPDLPSVTIFSATERAALALARVVVTRLCLIRLQTRLASIALRCWPVRPSLAVRLRWRIGFRLVQDPGGLVLGRLEQVRLESHAQRQPQRLEFVFDFVER